MYYHQMVFSSGICDLIFFGGEGGKGGGQDYFTHFELSQSLGGAKTGDP